MTRVKGCHLLARVAHLLSHEKALSSEALLPRTRNQISQIASLNVFLLTGCAWSENDLRLQCHLLRIEVLVSYFNIGVTLLIFKMTYTLRFVLKGKQEGVI